ncbi:MAG: hypothetical protein JNK67_02705 [Alphaproteobacteria bacterium]|nr:hypothetical protein [Alphaproteobacteria bacterium]
MNRVAEAATNTSTQAVLQRALPAALEAHGRGELDAAWTWLDEASRVAPNHPDVLHLRGLVALGRGQPSAAVAWIERAAGASPRTALYWNNLGVAWRAAGDLTRAAAAHRQAIALKPGYASAHNNLGAVLAAGGDYRVAAKAFAKAISLGARSSDIWENHAKALLCLGRFSEAWSSYRHREGRRLAPPERPWPRDMSGLRIALRREQGIGDQLFFLRFADVAVAYGAQVGIDVDPRLNGMLARSGLAGVGDAIDDEAEIGDLPWLLGLGDEDSIVPPLRLSVLSDRAARVAATLSRLPRPWIGVTWHAGGARGQHRTFKTVPIDRLGASLRDRPGTIVSVQRHPDAADHAALASALGRPLLDLSGWNEDLELMLALMAALDGYVGVSNANVHLRCGAGLGSDVLVPFPMDWRWRSVEDGTVPWYPGSRAYHQQVDGDWDAAFAALTDSLRSRWP